MLSSYSPRWLFLIPGLVLIALGLLGYALALPGVQIGASPPSTHTRCSSRASRLIVGCQSALFFLVTKAFAISEGLLPPDPRLRRFLDLVQLETGLLLGLLACAIGAALLLLAVNEWRLTGFGRLDYAHTMRSVIPGATLVSLGVQTAMSSFLVSLLAMQRR